MPYFFNSHTPVVTRLLLPALVLACPLAAAGVTLRLAANEVLPGSRCQISASRTDEVPTQNAQRWSFSVVEGNGGSIGRIGADNFYLAPMVPESTTFHLRVVDSQRSGDCETIVPIRVLGWSSSLHGFHANGSRNNRRLTDAVQVATYYLCEEAPAASAQAASAASSSSPAASAPALEPLGRAPAVSLVAGVAGHESNPKDGSAALFLRHVAAVCLEEAPAGMSAGPTWNWHAFVGDSQGFKVVDSQGKVSRPKATLKQPVTAIATPFQAPTSLDQVRVVYAQKIPASHYDTSSSSAASQRTVNIVCKLDGGLCTAQVLAGFHQPDAAEPAFQDGPGETAIFGEITGLVMAEDGSVFVADAGNHLLRKIDPQGRVSTLAGQLDHSSANNKMAHYCNTGAMKPKDGTGTEATFGWIAGLTMDRATGNLFVADGHAIRRVTPSGKVKTILGNLQENGFLPNGSEKAMLAHVPCLYMPHALQVLGDNLFIADTHNHALQVYNLRTHVLMPLVSSDGSQRMGPIHHFSPRLPLASRASLIAPAALSVDAGGRCVVGLNHGLAHVDLATFKRKAASPSPEWSPNLSPLPSPRMGSREN